MHHSQVLFKTNFEKEQKCLFRSKENIEFRMIWQESFHMTFMLFHSKRISKLTHFYQCLGMSWFILSPSTLPRIFLNAFFQGGGRRLEYFYFLSWLYRESPVLMQLFQKHHRQKITLTRKPLLFHWNRWMTLKASCMALLGRIYADPSVFLFPSGNQEL